MAGARRLLLAAAWLLPCRALRLHQPGTIRQDASCYAEPMNFTEFVRIYKRTYKPGSGEYTFRMGLFELHAAAAQMQNCKINSRWTAGVNPHSDWTETELMSLRGYLRGRRSRRGNGRWPVGSSSLRASQPVVSSAGEASGATELPDSVSWGHLAAIRAPRDQGQCGSCWAYSAETVMRAHAEIQTIAQNFSVDELITCVPNPQECGGQGGCRGATAELAFEYALMHGMSLEDDAADDQVLCPVHGQDSFPYPGKELFLSDGRELHLLGERPEELALGSRVGLYGWTKFPENREEPLVRALVEAGPLAVAVAAGWQWNLYKAGIMQTEESCEDNVITHAVVLFGYGTEDGMRYWHLKNSWGSWWGENGNIRLQRLNDEESACSWDTKPEVGTGCLGGPPQVWVCGSCGILYDVSMPHFRPLDANLQEMQATEQSPW